MQWVYFHKGLWTYYMLPPHYFPLSPGPHDHAWCYFHFKPSGEFPKDWGRETAKSVTYSTSSSSVNHRKWICANGQISTHQVSVSRSVQIPFSREWDSHGRAPEKAALEQVSNITASKSQRETSGENYCETRMQLWQIKSNYRINSVSCSPQP